MKIISITFKGKGTTLSMAEKKEAADDDDDDVDVGGDENITMG